MKVKIFDSNTKKYKHKYEFVNNTTADFRYVQPLFCRTMMSNARISGSVSQFVRLAPLVYPTFGKLQLRCTEILVAVCSAIVAFFSSCGTSYKSSSCGHSVILSVDTTHIYHGGNVIFNPSNFH